MKLKIIPYQIPFEQSCRDIIASLPDWFGLPESNAAFLADLKRYPSWVAIENEKVVGVITLREVLSKSYEITFLVVDPTYHRKGVGRNLVNFVEEVTRRAGGQWLHVKTLAMSHPDPHYALTREFYVSIGFTPLFESEVFWGKENPAVVLIKSI